MKVKGSYKVSNWEEKTINEIATGIKTTRVTAQFDFTGDLVGRAAVEYLMVYTHTNAQDQHLSSAHYVGLLQFKGQVSGHDGSFVIEDHGIHKDGVAFSNLKVVPESGVGGLKTITGAGYYRAGAEGCHFDMDCAI
jgi:hypothetical protein